MTIEEEPSDSEVSYHKSSYFVNESKKPVTADTTLSSLPQLEPQDFLSILKNSSCNEKLRESREILMELYERLSIQWKFEAACGFNLLFYGLGSKRKMLNDFVIESFNSTHRIVIVNGYYPDICIKSILNELLNILNSDALKKKKKKKEEKIPSNAWDLAMYLVQKIEQDVILLIHNIDGSNLRNEKAQSILASLASSSRIRIIASFDHINTPALWDFVNLKNFNWLYHDLSTFDSYLTEISYENSLLSTNSVSTKGVVHVLQSLTKNAQQIFQLLAKHQLQEAASDSVGLDFQSFYKASRDKFYVSNEITFRTILTEFKDHKIMLTKRSSVDGLEYLYIPFSIAPIQTILESIK